MTSASLFAAVGLSATGRDGPTKLIRFCLCLILFASQVIVFGRLLIQKL